MSTADVFHKRIQTFPLCIVVKKRSVFLGTTECYSLVFFLNKKKKNLKQATVII